MTLRQSLGSHSRIRIAAVSVLVLVALLWSVYEVLQPISNDQGVALWAGDVINKGGVLYRDAWDTRGPAPYYFTSLIVASLGRNAWGLRLVDLIIQAAGAWGISLLVRRLGGTRVSAALSAAFYVLWYASMQFQDSAQADGWVGVLLVFTALALVHRSPPTHWMMFASGLLLGICVLNKPTYGLCVLMPVIYAARQPVTASRWASNVAVAALGCILPVAVAVLYFWHKGALWTAYDVYIRYNVLVYGHLQDPWLARLVDAGQQLLGLPMLFAAPLVAIGIANVWRQNRYACALLVWWLVAMLLNQMIQHKPWTYEWLPTLAPYAILSGFAILKLPAAFARGDAVQTTTTGRVRTSHVTLAVIGVALLVGLLRPGHRVGKWVAHLVRGTPETAYQKDEYGEWGYQPASVFGIARYVRERTEPTDPVLFFGLLTGGTFYANRPSPTRFGVVRPLFDVNAGSLSFGPRYRAEFMSDVQQHIPKYVITYGDSVCGATRGRHDWRCTENFPEFRNWIVKHYQVAAKRAVFDIWRYGGNDASTPPLQPVDSEATPG